MIRYEEYLLAVALTLARWHRPVWSQQRRGLTCRCGSDLPCQIRRTLLRRQDWPGHRQLAQVLARHPVDPDGHCAVCRVGYDAVRYPCQPVRLAVHTLTTELADRILDGLS